MFMWWGGGGKGAPESQSVNYVADPPRSPHSVSKDGSAPILQSVIRDQSVMLSTGRFRVLPLPAAAAPQRAAADAAVLQLRSLEMLFGHPRLEVRRKI